VKVSVFALIIFGAQERADVAWAGVHTAQTESFGKLNERD